SMGFVISAVSGVSRGIRYLSNTNIVLTIGFAALIFILGPTLFLCNLLPSALMEYIGSFFDLMARSASWGPETMDFQSTWTVYYWPWRSEEHTPELQPRFDILCSLSLDINRINNT